MKVSARASVRDALRLRAAALDLLGGRQPHWSDLAACSAGTWDVLRRTERCALALKARIAAAERAVPDHAETAATRELQRILSARGHLQRIGRLAAAHGIPVIVLKGGLAALVSAVAVDLPVAELREVELLIAGHPLSQPLDELLAMARELRVGVPLRDRFRLEAAANYLLRGPLGWLRDSRFWTPAFASALFSLLGSAVDRRREWALAWMRPQFPSPWGVAARLERRSPRIGRWSRTAVKLTRLIVVRMAAWPVALAARLLASSALVAVFN